MAAWSDKLLTQRAKAAEQSRAAILPYIRRCLEMTMPWRLEGRAGASAFERIFDSTGTTGVQKSAARLQRDLTPPFQRWFDLEAGPLVDPTKAEAVNRQLESATAVCHAVLDSSAFSIASIESYADLLVSTGALLAKEGDDHNPILWKSAPAWALAIEEGASGRVDNVFWTKGFPAWVLEAHWPGASWPKAVRKKIADRSSDVVKVRQSTYFDSEIGAWRMAIQCLDGDGDQVVWDSARDRTNPWIVFRYWTTPGDAWGRGPVMLALGDIRTANKTVEMTLKAAAYALAPPLMVTHDGVVNPDTLRLSPHALIRVARTGGPMGQSIQPLNLGANFDVSQLVLADMRDGINKNLPGANSLPPPSGAVRSAQEWIQRTSQTQYETGAAFGRLNHEFVPNVVARVLDILDRRGVYGINWDLMKIDQLVMRVKVTSPLARGQNLEDVQTIVQFWELAKTLGGEAAFAQIANTADGLPRLAKLMGVPLWAVNDGPTRDAMARAAGEMAKNMMAANEGGAAQGAAPGAAPGAALGLVA